MRVMKNPLLDSIAQRKAKIGVVGLGYVGLPLGMAFAEAGFDVLGLDIDQRKIDKLQKGESDIKKLSASSDFSKAAEMDCIIICVPTPLTQAREPDMSFIINASEAVAPYVRPGQLF